MISLSSLTENFFKNQETPQQKKSQTSPMNLLDKWV